MNGENSGLRDLIYWHEYQAGKNRPINSRHSDDTAHCLISMGGSVQEANYYQGRFITRHLSNANQYVTWWAHAPKAPDCRD